MAVDIEVFLTKGFCPEFYKNLEAFTARLYARYGVYSDFDTFYENVRAKVEDVLACGAFDPKKGNFKSFVHSMIRNEATKIKSKNKKVHSADVYDYLEKPFPSTAPVPHSPKTRFLSRVEELALEIDEEGFSSDLQAQVVSPEVFAYLWLFRGEYRGENQI